MSLHRFIAETRHPLQLGLFLPVMSGGWTMSKAARSTSWDFRAEDEKNVSHRP
ncbi:MAG: hypothetical protein QM684_18495 [Rhizobium sp.]